MTNICNVLLRHGGKLVSTSSDPNSNLDLVKVKSKDFKYYENDKHFEELTKKYNKVKRHAKSLHFKLRKVDI